MNRKLFVWVLALLAGVVLVAGRPVAAQPATVDWNYVIEKEPNDAPAQANPIAYGDYVGGGVSLSDPFDYYKFSGQAGDLIALPNGVTYRDNTGLVLLDSAQNPVVLNDDSRWAELPATGTYYVKVTKSELYEWGMDYQFYLVELSGDEPNDSPATALPAEALSTVTGTYDYPCDDDWYRFEGRAGDVFPVTYGDRTYWHDPEYILYDAAGNQLKNVNILPQDGTYYLRMLGWSADDDDFWCNEGPYTVTFGYPMWVSADVNGLGGNAAIRQEDVAMRANQPGKWQLVFDGSDVGITKDVVALERLDDGSLLMSLGAAQSVPGIGQVMPQDIIRFIPNSLGRDTAGTFELYLDGSDVGLTTAGEKIDAIQFQPWDGDPNPLVISLSGSGSVPRQSGGALAVRDEDLINFVGTAYGANSAGKWRMNLDGSTVPGMAAEDINAAEVLVLDPARLSRQLLVFTDSFKINGITGSNRSLLDMGQGLAVKSLADKKIDAITIGVPLTP
jgi:hypothetical protein